MLKKIKDAAIAQGIRIYLKQSLKDYGEITHMDIDNDKKRIEMDLALKGDTEPLHVTINEYRIYEKDTFIYAELVDIVTSREWIDVLAKKHLVGVPITII